ncbi:Glutathione S-transferase domain protein [Rhodomicrobium vannielii ATCC 17100]|uniref:Glutathione S-transferase domain protein n=1 Tax=Rhodomicrobium vannielii (strain ATCC 17100 / DSM 162 / LMG 4299 / NCIMB 10020 / ATH 3.1.1) TaxID=648757 RepID=E3I3C1_RHOVT|nr:glutathione S-transferase family protein [Rhodomicrobium vannielii]ADP71482.1 Glutathione S-transferase domain protein [Rhodomicrobium vannielii ATCC 17100]
MASELIFYTNPMSRGRIVRWMLEEVGHPYRTEIVEYGPQMKSPPYSDINPMGKVPALRHGDAVVTETAAICAYLADAFPGAGLAPAPQSPARAAWYRWLFFGAGPLEAAITNKACGFEASEEKSRMLGYGSFASVMDTLEKAVSASDYLAGDTFSAADVYVGSQVAWGLRYGTMETRPAFERYWGRLKDRPAAIRAARIDDDLLVKTRPA